MNRKALYFIERSLAIVASIIFLQTLFFKFTAHPDSVYIFTRVGLEPYSRIGLGIVELLISFLLLFPKTSFYGAIGGILIMSGAIMTHLLILGIIVNNDNGTLFALALTAFMCCSAIVLIKKKAYFPKIVH